MVRDAARDYAQGPAGAPHRRRLSPRAYGSRHFQEMAIWDYWAPPFPEELAGGGLNYVSYGLIAREIERIDSGYRSMLSVQSSLVMLPIDRFGTGDSKEKILAAVGARRMDRLLRRLTEPDHGSDPGSMITQPGARTAGRRLSLVGRQDVDFQQPHRGCVRGVGKKQTMTSFAASFSKRAGRPWRRRSFTADGTLRCFHHRAHSHG